MGPLPTHSPAAFWVSWQQLNVTSDRLSSTACDGDNLCGFCGSNDAKGLKPTYYLLHQRFQGIAEIAEIPFHIRNPIIVSVDILSVSMYSYWTVCSQNILLDWIDSLWLNAKKEPVFMFHKTDWALSLYITW